MRYPSPQKHQDDVFSQAKPLRYLVVTLKASFTQNFRVILDVLCFSFRHQKELNFHPSTGWSEGLWRAGGQDSFHRWGQVTSLVSISIWWRNLRFWVGVERSLSPTAQDTPKGKRQKGRSFILTSLSRMWSSLKELIWCRHGEVWEGKAEDKTLCIISHWELWGTAEQIWRHQNLCSDVRWMIRAQPIRISPVYTDRKSLPPGGGRDFWVFHATFHELLISSKHHLGNSIGAGVSKEPGVYHLQESCLYKCPIVLISCVCSTVGPADVKNHWKTITDNLKGDFWHHIMSSVLSWPPAIQTLPCQCICLVTSSL